VKVRDVIELIERDGWRLDRQRGSHHIYNHNSKQGIVVMAGAHGSDVPAGTLGSILRQAGMKGTGRD
jgi:predicted RNA binding protein YcfA (HicA-like mRNA interferase family)